jgi:hypothetical protein
MNLANLIQALHSQQAPQMMPGIPPVQIQMQGQRLSTGTGHQHPRALGGNFQYHINQGSVRIDIFFSPASYTDLINLNGGSHAFPNANSQGNGTRSVRRINKITIDQNNLQGTAQAAVEAMANLWTNL